MAYCLRLVVGLLGLFGAFSAQAIICGGTYASASGFDHYYPGSHSGNSSITWTTCATICTDPQPAYFSSWYTSSGVCGLLVTQCPAGGQDSYGKCNTEAWGTTTTTTTTSTAASTTTTSTTTTTTNSCSPAVMESEVIVPIQTFSQYQAPCEHGCLHSITSFAGTEYFTYPDDTDPDMVWGNFQKWREAATCTSGTQSAGTPTGTAETAAQSAAQAGVASIEAAAALTQAQNALQTAINQKAYADAQALVATQSGSPTDRMIAAANVAIADQAVAVAKGAVDVAAATATSKAATASREAAHAALIAQLSSSAALPSASTNQAASTAAAASSAAATTASQTATAAATSAAAAKAATTEIDARVKRANGIAEAVGMSPSPCGLPGYAACPPDSYTDFGSGKMVTTGSGCGGPGQPACTAGGTSGTATSTCGGPGQPACAVTVMGQCGGPGQPPCSVLIGGKPGSFSGNCSTGFTCDGDPVQCAIAKANWERNCAASDSIVREAAEGEALAAEMASALGDATTSQRGAQQGLVDGITGGFESSKESWFSWVWTPPTGSCSPWSGSVRSYAINWDMCGTIANIRDVLGWMFALFGAWTVYREIFDSVGAS